MGGGMEDIEGIGDMAGTVNGESPDFDGSGGDFGSGEDAARESGGGSRQPPMDFAKSLNRSGTIRIMV
jgi:hypothetical protein